MSKNIFIYNYNDDKYDTGIPISQFKHIEKIHVIVVSGDEIITVFYKGGRIRKFDVSQLSGETREENLLDNTYDISTPEEFEDWLNRTESLDFNFY